jgi:hypothetical protein
LLPQFELVFSLLFSGNGRVFHGSISPTTGHAPQHIIDTNMWGVSDPAERPRGRGCEARAASLTPHLCSHSCAGALSGRHETPPDQYERSGAEMMQSSELRRRRCPRADRVSRCDATIAEYQTEPTAPRGSVPLLGPSRDAQSGDNARRIMRRA